MKTLNKKIILSIALFIFCFWGGSFAQGTDLDGDGVPDDIDACYNPGAPPGLVSHWGFEDGSGTTAVDSFEGNPGSLMNEPVWTTGKVGGALSFDGVDNYVEVTGATNIPLGSSARTLEAWLKPFRTAGENQGAIGWSTVHATRRVFHLYHYTESKYPVSDRNKWGILTYGDDPHFFGDAIVAGKWYHIVLTYEQGSTIVKAYIDGQFVRDLNLNGPLDTADSYTTIGGASWGGGNRFNGVIDEVAIYDRALSADEIVAHYNNGLVKCYCGPVVIYVDSGATGANDGTSWANAHNYLQDALAVAVSPAFPVQIWVAEGTYYPDANGAVPGGSDDRTATFQLINGVAIYGGFAGAGAADPNERDVEVYETILSGDINTPGDQSGNSYHVVTASGTDANAVLDGFTITAGNANGSFEYQFGGGMYNNSGSPTVVNCTFSGNSAGYRGGGMYNESSSPTVANCTFSGNSAGSHSGGMCNYSDSNSMVTNCTFTGNSANYGGGMSSENSSPTMTNCSFIGNAAQSQGGGMFSIGPLGSPTLTNCTFSGNSAISYGGAIHNYGSSLTLTNCTFSGNSAGDWGGGVCNRNESNLTVSNGILWDNTAATGAQIYNDGTSSATVNYSDVQGGWTGTGNIDEAPLFIDPNGLDGIPNTADDEEGYIHLRGYSPCINAGDPLGDYSAQVDIDGQPRVAYSRVDMGADEVFPIAGDFEPDGDVDLADFAFFARIWLLGAE